MKPTVGIIGCGIVGGNTARLFKELGADKVNVLMYDKYKQGDWNILEEIVIKSDFIFICLPTPMKPSGGIDLSFIDTTMEHLDELAHQLRNNRPIVIIRSTSVSGSSDTYAEACPHLEVAFVPEFLTEASPWEDTIHATRVVIGSENTLTFFTIKSLFSLVYGDKVTYIEMSRAEAEMYKYACNYLLSMSVLAANELYFICKAVDVDYQVIQRNLQYDKRIGTFTKVPGHDGDFGVGGKCFPKDINALAHLATMAGYDPEFLYAAIDLNMRVRKNKDWLEIPGAVSDCTYDEVAK
jgi:UDPglucose 6-dehydrogenase